MATNSMSAQHTPAMHQVMSRQQYDAMNAARAADGFGPLFATYEAYVQAVVNDNRAAIAKATAT